MSAELVEAGWFGTGRAHARIMDRVGDATLVMQGHYTLKNRLPGKKQHVLIGNHGGVTEGEMWVPLVVARL